MRSTHDFRALEVHPEPALVAALARPGALTTARYEGVFRERLGHGALDLVFEDDGEVLVLHGVFVDTLTLATLEGPPLVWPAAYALSAERADEIDEFIAPWLRTLVRGRGAFGEHVRSYRSSAVFAGARERGFRGAAPYAQSLARSAPFVYARRFAAGADVRITASDAYHAAAVLGRAPRAIEIVCDDSFAARWYGAPARQTLEHADLAIVDDLEDPAARNVPFAVAVNANTGARTVVMPQAVPLDQLFTFDPADAPEISRFAVRGVDSVVRPVRLADVPATVGGSGGRIVFLRREEAAFAPDADTDVSDELARLLAAEGITTAVAARASEIAEHAPDLVHVFGDVHGAHVVAGADAAQAAHVPFVVSLEPIAGPSIGYARTLAAAVRSAGDHADRTYLLDLFADGKLEYDGIPPICPPHEAAALDRRFGAACAGATAILLSPGEDVAAFRERFPEIPADRISAPPVLIAPEAPEDDVRGAIPPFPFALVHAPMMIRNNTIGIVAALAGTDVPLVVAGPVSDVEAALTIRRLGSPQLVVLPDPSPGTIAALYRRATVWIDGSLQPAGTSRILRAMLCGALPVVPAESPLAPLVAPELRFPARSFTAMANVVRAALARPDPGVGAAGLAAKIAPLVDGRGAFADVIAAYARAAAPAG